MPTYEYVCKQCEQHLEAVQSFYDAPLTVCEKCGGELRKVFGNIGIVFKGSGFYKTDSRGSSSAVTPPSSGGSTTTEASTAKPETSGTKSDTASSVSDTSTSKSSSSASKGSDSAA